MIFFLSEPFYLSHTKGSYTDWGRGVTQERDICNMYIIVSNIITWSECVCVHVRSSDGVALGNTVVFSFLKT